MRLQQYLDAQSSSGTSASPIMGGEAYASGEPISWDHEENPAGALPFHRSTQNPLTRRQTFEKKLHNKLLVKESRFNTGEAGALIISTKAGHADLGYPNAETNGEERMCTAVGIRLEVSSMQQAAISSSSTPQSDTLLLLSLQDHGQDACIEVDPSLISPVTEDLVARGIVPEGAVLTPITKQQLDRVNTRKKLREFVEMLAARGHVARLGDGRIAILVADKAFGSVVCTPRLLGSEPHGRESTDPSKWGRYVRVGPGLGVPTPNQQKMIDAVKAVHRKNGKQGA